MTETAASEPPSVHRPSVTRSFIALFAGLFLYVLNANLFALVPFYLATRGASAPVYAAAAGMLNLGGVAAMALLGSRADSVGRRRWVLRTLMVAGIGNAIALGAMHASPVWYVVATTCHGVVLGLGLPAMFVWASELGATGRRTEIFALLGIGGLLGDALGPALGEGLLATQVDPDAPASFWIVFVAANLLWPICVGAFCCVRDVPPPLERKRGAEWAELLRLPELRLCLLATVAFGGALGTMLGLGKNFVASVGLGYVSLLLGGHAAGAILVRLALPWILRRCDLVQLIPFALLGVGTSMALLAVTHHDATLLGAGLLYGVSHGVLFPSMLSRLIDYGGEHAAGRVSTLFMGMFGLGAGLWPLVGGVFVEQSGFRTLFLALALANVGAIALCRGGERHYTRRSGSRECA